ncbi:lysosomal thioesterase PPT2-A-like [Actinia tenebrosa]|uniref:palmitoyl-CoA hydrolase n=1 Tax=Actinia tenebrosa TaxID=6105 RepID=A0A6P8HNX9_ACTTE|nr:lysosomal thioesterase PPT2-A-like [Actinia tenebrosa]
MNICFLRASFYSSMIVRLFWTNMWAKFLSFFSCLAAFLAVSSGYKPVIIIHGILDHARDLNDLAEFIKAAHPGTNISLINIFEEQRSFVPLWSQINGYRDKIRPIMQQAEDGVHIIGFSQGGIIARGMIETTSDHNVDTLISLSSPQMGQYGDTSFLKPFIPDVVVKTAYKVFYTYWFQHLLSIANYWNDPYHEELNLKKNIFLPYINNNQCLSELSHSYFTAYETQKKNFLKLKNLILIGGPDDGVITPWESSQFGYYGSNNSYIKSMKEQEVYVQDSFGLRTLDRNRGVHTYTFSGIKHKNWHRSKEVFDKAIEPWLT